MVVGHSTQTHWQTLSQSETCLFTVWDDTQSIPCLYHTHLDRLCVSPRLLHILMATLLAVWNAVSPG